MNWYINQEIVCIKTHSQGVVKRGQIYPVKGLRKAFCKCVDIQIDVGVTHPTSKTESCTDCNIKRRADSDIWWLHESLFAPLEYNQQAIDELLEQPILIENENHTQRRSERV